VNNRNPERNFSFCQILLLDTQLLVFARHASTLADTDRHLAITPLSLFNELKRRNVFRVGIAYVIIAWFVDNPIEINSKNKFSSGQYD
jgi:hypothetical protein